MDGLDTITMATSHVENNKELMNKGAILENWWCRISDAREEEQLDIFKQIHWFNPIPEAIKTRSPSS